MQTPNVAETLSFSEDIHICGACKVQFAEIKTFLLHKQKNCPYLKLRSNNASIQNNVSNALCIANQKSFADPQNSPEISSSTVESSDGSTCVHINRHPNQQQCSVSNRNGSIEFEEDLTTQDIITPEGSISVSAAQNGVATSLSFSPTNQLLSHQNVIQSTATTITIPDICESEPLQHQAVDVFTSAANTLFNSTAEASSFFMSNELGVAEVTDAATESSPSADCQPLSNGGSDNSLTCNATNVRYLESITNGVRRFKCDFGECNYTSSYRKDLERHYRIHTGEKPYKCKQCGKMFNRSDKMKAHERWHSGIKPYECHTCSYAAGDKSSLKKHIRIHTDERPFKCQICPYASRNSSQLVVHLRTHTGDAPFQCTVCGTKFKINSDLKRHMRVHSGEKPYDCPLCSYRCSIKANLKTHIRLTHSEDNQLHCKLCDFATSSRKLLLEHRRTHVSKALKCSQCTYTARTPFSLKNHQRVHSEDKPFKCDHCSYSSRQPSNIRTHQKKCHPEKLSKGTKRKHPERDIDECSDQASNEKTRSRRVSCKKTFHCTLCDSSFVREESLRAHLRQHRENTSEPVALAMLQLHQPVESSTDLQQQSLEPKAESSNSTTQVTSSFENEPVCESSPSQSSSTLTSDKNMTICLSGENVIGSTIGGSFNSMSITSTNTLLNAEENLFRLNTNVNSISSISLKDSSNYNTLEQTTGNANEKSENAQHTDDILNFNGNDDNISVNGNITESNTLNSASVLERSMSYNNIGLNQYDSQPALRTATMLARLQNHKNLAQEDNIQNATVANNIIPTGAMVTQPSHSITWGSPNVIQNSPSSIDSTKSAIQNSVDGTQFLYQLPNSLGFITIPVLSINRANTSSQQTENIVAVSHPTAASNTASLPIQQPTTFLSPSQSTVVQLSNLQPNIQYILQPTTDGHTNPVRLELSGLQVPSGNNVITSNGTRSSNLTALQSSGLLTLGSPEQTLLLGSNASTDSAQKLLNNLNVQVVGDASTTATVLPQLGSQTTFPQVVLSAVAPNIGAGIGNLSGTSMQESHLNNVIYPVISLPSDSNSIINKSFVSSGSVVPNGMNLNTVISTTSTMQNQG